MLKETEFERQLEAAVCFHGHLCGGQVIGTRMAMAGLRELGIKDPRGVERKDFVAIVETDRCATDAIIAVTGLTPGKRSIKILDYGKMAATFVHLPTGKAVRVSVRNESRDAAMAKVEAEDKDNPVREKDAYLNALIALDEKELLHIQEVEVRLGPEDLPGSPLAKAVCVKCGETVLDRREAHVNGLPHCQPCAAGQHRYLVSPTHGSKED